MICPQTRAPNEYMDLLPAMVWSTGWQVDQKRVMGQDVDKGESRHRSLWIQDKKEENKCPLEDVGSKRLGI